jgi:purine catabolism regulator
MEAASVSLLLGDLLDDATLGLELLVGGDEARSRPVEGAHSIEVLHPARWLDQGWVMLTTGIALADDDESQRQLVAELDENGVAALGFDLGTTFSSVPRGLVEEARRRDFPLFTVPPAVPFRDIIGAVQRGSTSSDARNFGRLAAAQRYLVDALGQADPQQCILDRLGELCGAHVALLDRHGAVLAGQCPLDDGERMTIVARACHHTDRVDLQHGRGWLFVIGAGRDAAAASWLIAMPKADGMEHPMLKATAQIAVPLLEAAVRLEESRREEDQAVRRATLAALIDAEGEQDAGIAAARTAAWGIAFEQGVCIAVVQTRTVAAVPADALLDEVESRMSAMREPWLATVRDAGVVVLVSAAVAAARLEQILCDAHRHALVGVGRTITRPADVRCSHLDSELAVAQLARRGPARIAFYDDLDFGTALIAEIPPERIKDRVDRWLEPLVGHPMAYETLVTYLDHDLDVGRTSRALKLHPNSTRYRLTRVEELLGAPLRRPSTIAALHFALLSKRYNNRDDVQAAPPAALQAV